MFAKVFVVVVFVSYLALKPSSEMLAGGISEAKDADAETQRLVNKVKPQLEKETNASYTTFKAVSYKTQVVAGTNKFVKVDVGNGQYIHLRIFEPLPYTRKDPELSAYLTNKMECDEIDYF